MLPIVIFFRALNLGGPFIIGHLSKYFNYNYNQNSYQPLSFCVRELTINGILQDFSDPLLAQEISPSCALTQSQCTPNPCKNGGQCIGSQSSFTCVCETEYAGEHCTESKECICFHAYHVCH